MARGPKKGDEGRLTSEDREDLERIVVRLLNIAARCTDPSIQGELMELADELVKVID